MSEDRPTVALLGTGMMGSGMARSLLRAGLVVRVWNRTVTRTRPLAAEGAVACATPAEAADGADMLITMMLDARAVEAAVAGPGGALAALPPDAVWLQTSTVGTAQDELAEVARRHGITFFDVPVVGTPAHAAQGGLGVLVAGPSGYAERLRPVLEAIGARTLWVGSGCAASRLKLVVNSWVLGVTLALAEAVALAEAAGLDPRLFLDAVEGSPLGAEYARLKGSAMIEGDLNPTFSVRAAVKDAQLVADLAGQVGARPLGAQAVLEQYQRAVDLGYADCDLSAVYHAARPEPALPADGARR